jgi:hypothetical protein
MGDISKGVANILLARKKMCNFFCFITLALTELKRTSKIIHLEKLYFEIPGRPPLHAEGTSGPPMSSSSLQASPYPIG